MASIAMFPLLSRFLALSIRAVWIASSMEIPVCRLKPSSARRLQHPMTSITSLDDMRRHALLAMNSTALETRLSAYGFRVEARFDTATMP